MSKKLSGAQRRKLAREEEAAKEAFLKKVPKLTSFFSPGCSSNVAAEGVSSPDENLTTRSNLTLTEEAENKSLTLSSVLPCKTASQISDLSRLDLDKACTSNNFNPLQSSSTDNENELLLGDESQTVSSIILSADPSTWPEFLQQSVKDDITLKGPLRQAKQDHEYPKNHQMRHFSNEFFYRCADNGERVKRRWLVYSNESDAVFCFCCRIFESKSKSQLGQKSGLNDWKHLGERLRAHETSPEHFKYMVQWVEAETRLKGNVSIKQELLNQIRTESERWQEVLKRIVAITIYLAEHNIAFRGSSDKLFTQHNGNFLGLVQLLGQFDAVMMDHLRRVESVTSPTISLLSPKTQNEIITLLGEKVKLSIIQKVKNAKYFSVIMDSTPDISHRDQISLTIRCVLSEEDETSEAIKVEESFISFKAAHESTGEALSTLLFEEIEACHLDMNDCRGQAYDNGANMAGAHKGVQTRVLKEYPRASFTPCSCHSLNLVVSDGAKSSVKSTLLFGILQRLYTIFAASTKRYCVISEHVTTLSLKQVCETRWEARINSLQAVRYQYSEIRESLIELSENVDDSKVSSEALSLVSHMEDFSFLVSLILWYDLLFQVNIVSKSLQSKTADLPSTMKLLQRCEDFLKTFRENGLADAIISAKEIAKELEMETSFPKKRRGRMKQVSKEDSNHEEESAEDIYRREVFLPLVDSVTISLNERTKQLKHHQDVWGFLYNLNSLPTKDELKKCCLGLEDFLTVGGVSDINGRELFNEIQQVKSVFCESNEELTPVKLLRKIKSGDHKDLFTNLWISLRILVTIPVTVASAERSFSKLKLIKTYLRSAMTQDRLTALAILSIENEEAKKLDFKDIVRSYANAKVRKIPLGM